MKLNLPNKITLLRICMIPLMFAAYYIQALPHRTLIAAGIFLLAAATDALDGNIARRTGQVTNMGKFLDPIADKVLVAAALFLVVESQIVPAPYAAISASLIIARELAISGFRQIAAANNVIISADRSGKIKAVLQDAALFVLICCIDTAQTLGALYNPLLIIGYVLLGAAVALTIISGINYVVKNIKVITDGR